MSNNPLLQIYDTFWKMLEDSSHFTNLVLVGNRVNYSEHRPNERDVIAGSADVPEVSVVLDTTQWNAFSDSCGTGYTLVWSVRVATGEADVEELLDVHWAVIRALANWQSRMNNLVWEDDNYVKSCRALKVAHSLDNKQINKGTRGWSDVWTGEIMCWFKNFDLQI